MIKSASPSPKTGCVFVPFRDTRRRKSISPLLKKKPPDILYHGTASRFLSAILAEGLTAQSRQYVHLSADREVAIQVGQRYGTPVVLEINALAMFEQGYPFYQAENGVWLTRQVAVEFISQ